MTDLFTERDKKKAKAFVKGANTGIAQALGFPVDAVTYAINMSPLLVNLLPGKQGMKPFSIKNPVGGSQMFKDAMAAGNIGTYKDVASIPKDEYGAGIAGMLSSEALTSLIPISQLVKGLPRGSKTVLPQQTATGVDLSRRDLLKKAGAAAVATAVSPSIIKEIGDVLPSGATTKAVKAGAKSGVSLATSLAAKLKGLSEAKDKIILKPTKANDVKAFGDYLDATNQINDEMNAVTVQLNDTVEKLVKGKGYEDFMKMPEKEFAELARLTNKVVHNFRNKKGEIVGSLDPLRDPKIQKALDKAITDRGLRPQIAEDFANEMLDALRLSDKKGGLPPMDLSGLNLPKMLPSGKDQRGLEKMLTANQPKSIFEPELKRGRQLLIVSCSKDKCPDVGNMKALDRYTGMLFTKMKKAGIPPNVDVAILSAKHGLIRSDTPIEKYDQLMTDEVRDSFLNNPDALKTIRDTMAGDYSKVFVTGGKNYKDVIQAAAGDLDYEVISKKAPGLTQQAVVKKLKEAGDFFHYTDYTEDQIKNFDISFVEKKNRYGEFKDILGLHVGGRRSAEERGINLDKRKGEITAEDLTGTFYSLDLDTSKPFKNPYHKSGIWSEDGLEDFIVNEIIDKNPEVIKLKNAKANAPNSEKLSFNDKIDKAEKDALSTFRKGLASRGFTNVPYINAQEDAGSLSHIMLIDRPKGDKVIKSKITAEPMEKGGVAGLSDMARDMFKGPKGIGAYQPFMVG